MPLVSISKILKSKKIRIQLNNLTKRKKSDAACPPICACDSRINVGSMSMPAYGYGTWQLRKAFVDSRIRYIIDMGIRHIDTSPCFENQAEIGKTLERLIYCGDVCREELFISSKLPHYAMQPGQVSDIVKRSLESLRLDYLDLFMIHYPVGVIPNKDGGFKADPETDHAKTWEAMESMVNQGCVKNIGVSNFNLCQLENLLKIAKVRPTNLQIELHVYHQQKELRRYACCEGISVTAYAPLGSPHLEEYLQLNDMESNVVGYPLKEYIVEYLAQKYKRTSANILLKYWLQQGVAVIPKSEQFDRICSNFNVFSFEIEPCDMEILEALDKGEYGKMFDKNVWRGTEKHKEYPFVRI